MKKEKLKSYIDPKRYYEIMEKHNFTEPQCRALNGGEAWCDVCEKSGEMHRCGGCKCAIYCSVECQKQDWKNHKNLCGDLAELRVRGRLTAPRQPSQREFDEAKINMNLLKRLGSIKDCTEFGNFVEAENSYHGFLPNTKMEHLRLFLAISPGDKQCSKLMEDVLRQASLYHPEARFQIQKAQLFVEWLYAIDSNLKVVFYCSDGYTLEFGRHT